MQTDPNRLLQQAAKGDQQSFKLLYDSLAPSILAFLMKMLNDRHMAEDVLQEAMIQSWRKAAQFDATKAKASTWIISIARNRALDLLRKTGRFNRAVTESDFQISQVLYAEAGEADKAVESKRTRGRLRHCFGELSEDSAACIRLAYVNGFTFSEIADYRDHSINTVKSWVRRGLALLSECMQR